MGDNELMGICYASSGLRVVLQSSSVVSQQSSLISHSKKLQSLLCQSYPRASPMSLNAALQSKAKDAIRKGVPVGLVRDLAMSLWTLPGDSQTYASIRAQNLETETYAAECPTFSHSLSLSDVVPDIFLSPDGVLALQRVLWAVSDSSQDRWFCPILPVVTAISLLFLSESETFLLITALIRYSESVNSHPNLNWNFLFTELQHKRLYGVVRDFLYVKEKALVIRLEDYGVSWTELAETLIGSFYMGRLHWVVLCRLYCCFLSEGTRILVRFTVATVRKLKPQLMGLTTTRDVLTAITVALNNLHSAEGAFKAGISLHMPKTFPFSKTRVDREECVPMQATYDHLQVVVPSSILPQGEFQRLWHELPSLHKLKTPRLLYSSEADGIHLPTLLRKAQSFPDCFASILLFHSLSGWKFGLYLDTWVRVTKEFVGGADSFLFTMKPTESFSKVREDSQFVIQISTSQLTIGSGPHGPALSISSDLSRGYSAVSTTFLNPLIENGAFVLKAIELFILTS